MTIKKEECYEQPNYNKMFLVIISASITSGLILDYILKRNKVMR